jgi:hypothetical protein
MKLFVDHVNKDESISATIAYYREMGIQLALERVEGNEHIRDQYMLYTSNKELYTKITELSLTTPNIYKGLGMVEPPDDYYVWFYISVEVIKSVLRELEKDQWIEGLDSVLD